MREEISREELYAAGRDRRQKMAEEARKGKEDAFMRKDPKDVIAERVAAAQAPPQQAPAPPLAERPIERPAPERPKSMRTYTEEEQPQRQPEARYVEPAQQPVYKQYPSARPEAQRSDADVSLGEILQASGMDEKTFKKELILYLIDFLNHEQKSINNRIQDLESLIR